MSTVSTLSDPPIRWQPDPDFRGTYNIISTCLATLLLCLWSAVHVDVPIHPCKWRGLWVRIGWTSIGLVTPETLLFIAYRQWTIAGEILKVANSCEAFSPSGPQDFAKKRHRWTMKHCYYAAMSGFVFDTQADDKKPFLPPPYTNGRGVITPEGIHFLLKHRPDLLPDLSVDEISDRNKGNSLSKSVVVVQVTFFLIDCVARKNQGLPITLLKVTTVAHALCSLLAYGFWWDKPLSVTHPTLIRGEDARQICALMCMASTCRHYFLAGYLMIWRPAELDSLCYTPPNSERPHIPHLQDASTIYTPFLRQDSDTPNLFCPLRTLPKDGMSPWLDRKLVQRYLGQPWYRNPRLDIESAASVVNEMDIRRWELASVAALTLMRHIEKLRESNDDKDALVSPNSGLSACLKFRGGNPRKFTLNENDPGPAAAVFLALLFGFPSLTAWNYMFPTPFDQLLWRVAAIAATTRGTVYFASRWLGLSLSKRFPNNWLLRKAAAVIPVCLLMGMLIPSSTILVLESFNQLFFLPRAAYKVPTLSRYWPHF
ncbi:hypothetical protein J3R30DRAFT_3283205 [Lentinula aciculospora]|uniref:Uncharacterized protein n=1 Tax=Lentinula aciculospora TaxID=153920 RepID=A0A9W9AN37_9AGAR|nr:hypothetical protein J3R30DRAFT_3283205 [Lentinula aciculospora]